MTNVNVYPGAPAPTHQISLSDGIETWGLRLANGPRSLQEIPLTPSTIHISGRASKFGDYEPGLSQIAGDTWVGGRGLDDFSLDSSRFFDSNMTFTMVDGKAFPVPQWRWAEGHHSAANKMPGAWTEGVEHDVKWQSLANDYFASQFTTDGSGFTARTIQLIARRKGLPGGNLKAAIYSNNSGEPNAAVQTATVAPASVDAFKSQIVELTITSQALSSSTTYWVVVYDDDTSTANAANHWEIGYETGHGDQAKTSTDSGSSWDNTSIQLHFRVAAAEVERRWKFFDHKQSLYAVSIPADGTASTLFINGDHGKATAGTSTTLTDSNSGVSSGWVADQWIGAWVRIISGTGKGQRRQITDNTSTALTVAAWDVTPDTTSIYVIYATDMFQDITPSSGDQFDTAVTDVLSADEVVYFARSASSAVLKMEWNTASVPDHNFRDDGGSNSEADLLYGFTDSSNAFQLYFARNDNVEVYRHTPVAYGSNLSTGTNFDVGDSSAFITGMIDYDQALYVFKEDGLYRIASDKALLEDTGLGFIRSENTGQASVNRNFFLYFSWGGFAIMQLQKNASLVDLASVGVDRGDGMPEDRTGEVAALGFHPAGLLAAIDAGDTGYSSVMVRTDPVGWHEIFRGYKTDARIRDFYWQDCPGTFPRLWIDMGNDIVFQEWPRNGFNPLKDSGIKYQHECSITLADIDMGAARLPKFFKEISAVTRNLTTGIELAWEYQIDKDIGGDTWLSANTMYASPDDSLPITVGDARRIRLRVRMLTNKADTPPILIATVLEGFARTPLKYQWNMEIKIADSQRELSGISVDHDPDDLYSWLKDAARNAKKIRMRSIWEQMDNQFVIVEPPGLYREFTNNILGYWGGKVVVTIREA